MLSAATMATMIAIDAARCLPGSSASSASTARLPVFVRISATDWVDGGWDPDQSVELARQLRPIGADLRERKPTP